MGIVSCSTSPARQREYSHIERLENRLLLSAELVKDIGQTGAESRPTQLARIGDRVFFAAADETHGMELWASDGTSGGTFLVKDINPGPGDSGPRYFADINGTAYFSADDGIHGFELWKSDGTESGTVLIKDLKPGAIHSEPREFTSFNGEVYFTSPDYYTTGLWKTDGTEDGTVLVKDPGDTGQSLSFQGLIRVGDLLFMSGGTRASGYELWKSDGTTNGTVLVKQIAPGLQGGSRPQNFHEYKGMLIFVAQTAANGYELWKSDGTAAETVMLKDIVPGSLGGVSPYAQFASYNNLLWFGTYDNNTMWKTDGTPEGTVRTSNGAPSSIAQMGGNLYFIDPDGNGVSSLRRMDGTGAIQLLHGFTSDPVSPRNAEQLTTVGDRVLFTAPDAASGIELWSTDGTPQGTTLLKDIYAGSNSSSPQYLTALNGKVIFSALEPTGGLELWQSDGTEAGTALAKDINPANSDGAGPIEVLLNDTGYFLGGGSKLWRTDGTAEGTQGMVDVPYYPYRFTEAGGKIFFTAGGHNFAGLWATDGTQGGTYALPVTVDPSVKLVSIGNTTYFSPNYGTPGLELWRTDGTPGGTSRVKTINPVLNWFSTIYVMEATNDKLFFQADDGVHGAEFWVSDGTDSGTFMLTDIVAGTAGSNPLPLTTLKNQMLFAATAGGSLALWKTDGSSAGTSLIRELGSGSVEYSIFRKLVVIDGRIFFEVKKQGSPNQIWVTDGTSAGTELLLSMPTDSWTQVGSQMFFVAYAAAGRELWKSDGTPAGTTRVAAIGPALANTYGGGGIDLNGTLLFSVDDGTHGSELWRSDGTETGTAMLSDFNPGPASFYASSFTELEGTVYFLATDPVHGYEVWRTDGTAAGTSLVQDIYPGPGGSSPTSLTVINGMILFSADNSVVGEELWRIVVPQARIVGSSMVVRGASIMLSAADSDNPHGQGELQYAWDLDGDGQFGESGSAAANGDETGVIPSFSPGDLPLGEWPVRLAVSNSSGQTSMATSYIAITPPNFISFSPDASFEWSGPVGARVLSLHHGNLTINGDLSVVYPNASILADDDAVIHVGATQHLRQLTLLDSTTLDLGNSAIFIAASQLADMRQLIKSGRIMSSAVTGSLSLGIGSAIDGGSVKVMPALLGDLNLDTTVSISDFIVLASHFGQASANWSDGDLNYDNQVSIADFISLASNFGESYSAGLTPAAAPSDAVEAEGIHKRMRSEQSREVRKRLHHRKPWRWSPTLRRWEPRRTT